MISLQSQITGDRVIWLLSKFLDELRATTAKARKTFSEVLDYTTGASESDKTPAKDSNRDANSGKKGKRQRSPRKGADSERKHKKPKLDDNKSQKDPPTKVARCNHCNSKLHDDDGCTYVKHPDYVMKGSKRDSDVGLAYKNLDPKAPYIKDDRKLNKDMSKFVPIGSEKKPSQRSRQEKIKTGNVQTCCADCATTEPISDTKELDDILVPVTLFHREAKSRSLTAVALLDTGSRYRDNRRELNTISRSVVKRIVEVGGVLYEDPARLCFGSSCKTYKNAIDLNVSLLFDLSKYDVMDLGNLTFQVTENLPDFEVVIGW